MLYLGSSDADDEDKDGLSTGSEKRLGTDPRNPDTDSDGLKDGEEVRRYRTSPLETDTDKDGISDGDEVLKYRTDPARYDTDTDGLGDGDEAMKYMTDPLRMDTDGDGLTDGEEVTRNKTNPLKVDTDGDGLGDWDEVKSYKTDPNNPDTDGDGLADGDEVRKHRTDPTKPDTDGGGASDGAEVKRGTNPLDPRDDAQKGEIVLEKGKSVVIQGIYFQTGSAKLTLNSEQALKGALRALNANPDLKVEIVGHTDDQGNARSNDRLSLGRAETVRGWFVQKGIAPTRLTTLGKGSREPVAPNTTAEGRAKNRRIEFRVK